VPGKVNLRLVVGPAWTVLRWGLLPAQPRRDAREAESA
jgi:hypothetical protein